MHQEKANRNNTYGLCIHTSPKTMPDDMATAPYNFVSLPLQPLPSPIPPELVKKILNGEKDECRTAFREYIENVGKLSGYIKLNITTRTPLFIGGNDRNITDSFAPIVSRPIIAGSTLRGLVKNIIKIITCGTIRDGEDITSKHLYYRCLMTDDDTPFNQSLYEAYTARMTYEDEKGKKIKKAKAGFLTKIGSKYYIYSVPLHSILILDFENKYFRDEKPRIYWDGINAFCLTGARSQLNADIHKFHKFMNSKEVEEFFKVTPEEKWSEFGKQYIKYMQITDIDPKNRLEVPDTVIDGYKMDKNRRGVNLLWGREEVKHGKELSKITGLSEKVRKMLSHCISVAPCFFITDEGGNIQGFGHSRSFRIPYNNSVADAVPRNLREKNFIDFADAILGRSYKKSSWASRVFFGDAIPNGKIETLKLDKISPLMTPNPTSYQLYLRQDNEYFLKHWDSQDVTIRGYKIYWHKKNGHDWRATDSQKRSDEKRKKNNKQTLLASIVPISAGQEFVANVRFANLSSIELGALLKVFCLSSDSTEDIVYKIGRGKSVGLGSVAIAAELYLEDGSCYKSLFDTYGWHDSTKSVAVDDYINSFETYIKESEAKLYPDKSDNKDVHYEEIINELKNIMNFNHTKLNSWEYVTAPMNGDTYKNMDNRFKNRNILPDIATVVNRALEQSPKKI